MIEVKFNFSDFERWAEKLDGAVDQLPFALSTVLNDAAFKARQVFIETTWPQHVEVHNKGFLSAALRIDRSSKTNLSVTIKDVLGRAHLEAHAKGGTKRAAKRYLAIPVKGAVRRGVHGPVPSQTPAALIARTPPKALRITSKGIFTAEHGRLHMRYSFSPSARIEADVPFYQDFFYVMKAAIRTGFPDALARAMATRR